MERLKKELELKEKESRAAYDEKSKFETEAKRLQHDLQATQLLIQLLQKVLLLLDLSRLTLT